MDAGSSVRVVDNWGWQNDKAMSRKRHDCVISGNPEEDQIVRDNKEKRERESEREGARTRAEREREREMDWVEPKTVCEWMANERRDTLPTGKESSANKIGL